MNYLLEPLENPTRLYIKQCPHCGLKYFGKSIREDIEKYYGSGKRWSRHLKKHNVEPVHIWNSDWYTDTSIIRFALKFSKINNIVKSSYWANLMEENGIDGGTLPKETYKEISVKVKGIPRPWISDWQKQRHKLIRDGKKINPHSRRWEITRPDGTAIIVDDLPSFCKEHNISQGNLSGGGKTKGYSARCLGYLKDFEIN
jgi:hypothetical protein